MWRKTVLSLNFLLLLSIGCREEVSLAPCGCEGLPIFQYDEVRGFIRSVGDDFHLEIMSLLDTAKVTVTPCEQFDPLLQKDGMYVTVSGIVSEPCSDELIYNIDITNIQQEIDCSDDSNNPKCPFLGVWDSTNSTCLVCPTTAFLFDSNDSIYLYVRREDEFFSAFYQIVSEDSLKFVEPYWNSRQESTHKYIFHHPDTLEIFQLGSNVAGPQWDNQTYFRR